MTVETFNPLSLENPVMNTLLLYYAILVLKMMAMSVLTVLQRLKNKVSASPEDAVITRGEVKVNEDVERVRRAHLNDLENILIFFPSSWVYMLTNPNQVVAVNLFRVFTAARIAHTFVYAVVMVPQPARAIAFFAGYIITGYMTIASIVHFSNYF